MKYAKDVFLTPEEVQKEIKQQLYDHGHSCVFAHLKEAGFFEAPASTKYHGAYAGGLARHSFQVAARLEELTTLNRLSWLRPESPLLIGILHDACKIDQYEKVLTSAEAPAGWSYKKNTLFAGHGTKSLIKALNWVDLTEEEQACICYHMGAFTDKEEWKNYTNAISRYENVLWTHHADMLASHVDNI